MWFVLHQNRNIIHILHTVVMVTGKDPDQQDKDTEHKDMVHTIRICITANITTRIHIWTATMAVVDTMDFLFMVKNRTCPILKYEFKYGADLLLYWVQKKTTNKIKHQHAPAIELNLWLVFLNHIYWEKKRF